ncbi:acyl-CoA carboxylase epsilon subunit [Herbidospora mongoliensis]|uniref:acyl-CoA carboxylase epsilon subunit n=1 Tax=Herbidospora mongoliensis TaxID=688067 RepID=UPI00082AEC5A|nr:acyl-CoA carboxylase epsilon subunit [Herbidospora mongoliensis]
MNGLRVTKGDPSPEELAALVAALLAARDIGPVAPPSAAWRELARQNGLRRSSAPGRHAWRQSTWNLGGRL